ncbi:MAG TPA: sensor domain-containing diguanylate cyclase [Acidimicrobiales bacterium]|nr:sensor domain-containing diguanylate cyclase [Acidimicrobiales bacterium]
MIVGDVRGWETGVVVETDEEEVAPAIAERLVRALDRSPSSIVILIDEDLQIRWLSRSASWVTGSDPDDREGTSSLDRIHPDDVGRILHALDQLRTASQSPLPGPTRPVSAPLRYRFQRFDDDRWVVMEAQVHNLLDDPDVRGMLVISRQVTGELDGVGHVIDLLVTDAPMATVLGACAGLVPDVVGTAAVVGLVDGSPVIGAREGSVAEHLVADDRWWTATLADGEVRAPGDFAGFPDVLADKARAEGFRTAWVSPLFDGATAAVVGCLVVWVRTSGERNIVDDDALRQAERLASMVIGEQRRHHALDRAAVTDPLTGVGNRAALHRRLDAAGDTVAMAIIDLDDFKPVNDRHGHETGDAVLKVVAKRLSGAVREGDLVVRFGGDEFAVVFAAGTPGVGLAGAQQRIVEAIEAPIKLRNGLVLSVTASVGFATAAPSAVTKAADTALYRAKHLSRTRPD